MDKRIRLDHKSCVTFGIQEEVAIVDPPRGVPVTASLMEASEGQPDATFPAGEGWEQEEAMLRRNGNLTKLVLPSTGHLPSERRDW